MTHKDEHEEESEVKETFADVLLKFEKWLSTVGVMLPGTGARLFGVVGSLSFSSVDLITGSIALSWIFSQRTPADFLRTAKMLGVAISIALFYVVRVLVDDKDGVWWRGRSLYGWMLNVIDSFIDSSVVFIMFGLGDFIMQPGLRGFFDAAMRMPLVGWFLWFVIFAISFTAEFWRELMSKDLRTASRSTHQPQHQSMPHQTQPQPHQRSVDEMVQEGLRQRQARQRARDQRHSGDHQPRPRGTAARKDGSF